MPSQQGTTGQAREQRREVLFAGAVRLEGRNWLLTVTLINVLVWAATILAIIRCMDEMQHARSSAMLIIACVVMSLHLLYAWCLALSLPCVVREDMQGWLVSVNIGGSLALQMLGQGTSLLFTRAGPQVHWVYNTWYSCLLLLRFDAILGLQCSILIGLALLEAHVLAVGAHSTWQGGKEAGDCLPLGSAAPSLCRITAGDSGTDTLRYPHHAPTGGK
eukprot:jgi/Botrbrau1/15897/Bobra.40_1s0079.1